MTTLENANPNTPLDFTVTFDNHRVEAAEPGIRYMEILVKARPKEDAEERPVLPLNIALVIDRSGSMGQRDGSRRERSREILEPFDPEIERPRLESRLDTVKRATLDILDRLTPADRFALVTYDDEIDVPIPSGSIEDVDRARDIVQSLRPGGCTDLGGGLEAGFAQARRGLAAGGAGSLNRVFLLSDGLANRGITSPHALQDMAAEAAGAGVSLSTFGVGLNFNELLLANLAEFGHGMYYYLERSAEIAPALAQEFLAAREAAAKGLRAVVSLDPAVEVERVFANRSVTEGGRVVLDLGDIAFGETRRVLLRLRLPRRPAGHFAAGWVKLERQDAAGGERFTETREPALEYGHFGASLTETLNREVAEQAEIFEARYALFDAAQAREEGRIRDARRMTQASMARLSHAPAFMRKARSEAGMTAAYSAFLDMTTASPEEVQQMQKRVRSQRQILKKGE